MRRPAVLPVLTVVYLAAVAWITLNPAPGNPEGNPLLRALLRAVSGLPGFGWVTGSVAEFTANILLFVPMGVLFTLLLGAWRWWLALAIGATATLLIEFVQLFLPARVSDPRDLLANTLGTAIGVALCALAARRRRST
ncbi:VanZ family protein [Leifsonia shinshuensis]|uniref:VanZ family protein n=1 Tax=Leifsonia shinshuensis TaxID=150026 RepID=UPI00285D4547|nr:VanZ family protein [Leifsonia shinshuensis]MDR6970015.1 glycopeptide antibiotics resistance protein [Leifsonia shinshuensis]